MKYEKTLFEDFIKLNENIPQKISNIHFDFLLEFLEESEFFYNPEFNIEKTKNEKTLDSENRLVIRNSNKDLFFIIRNYKDFMTVNRIYHTTKSHFDEYPDYGVIYK